MFKLNFTFKRKRAGKHVAGGGQSNPDLDLAFELQIQEAMALSLSLQPSPFYHEDEEDDDIHTVLNPPAEEILQYYRQPLDFNDDVLSALNFQAEEYELEILDFQAEESARTEIEPAQTDKKSKMAEVKRLIEGQRLAGEAIPVVPRRRCRFSIGACGDGASSSSAAIETEIFRVYFKGLVIEEVVGGETVAAVGAAIYDSREKLVVKVAKPLICLGNVSREAAEIEALIEGLNAALTFKLKAVAFLCDDPMVYHYFSGREVESYHSKVSMLRLSHAVSLRSKFMYSSPFLLAQNDTNPAFKLASDCLLSQIIRPRDHADENCVICLEDTEASRMFTVKGCLHRFCNSCMRQHLEVKLQNGIDVPRCPHEGCTTALNIESCKELLTPEFVVKMQRRVEENAIPLSERIYCPYHKCSVPMSKFDALKNSRNLKVVKFGGRKCVKCHKLFCINCRVPWHANKSCAENKKLNPYPYVDCAKLNTLAASKRWRECDICNHMIELAEGCYHVTCRCGNEFCYTCGAEWRNKKRTCKCPMWDEDSILRPR